MFWPWLTSLHYPQTFRWAKSTQTFSALGILLRYSEAVVRIIRKVIGKQLCRSPFLNKVASGRPVKKETPTQVFFKNTSGRLHWKLRVFFTFFWQFFTRIPEIIGTFGESFIFQIIGLFLVFMSGFYTMKPKHVDQPNNWKKQRIYWQSIHASVNTTKIRNLHYFSKVFVV